MAKNGKIEALITVPTGGWDMTVTDDTVPGGSTVTLPAGTYYLSSLGNGSNDLIAELQAQLVAHDNQWTATIGAGEAGTGRVTIATDGVVGTIVWIDTDLRDLLGYTGTLSGATSYLSPDHARCIWLPTVPKVTPYGDSDDGHYEADARANESNSGHVKTLYSDKKQVLAYVEWSDVALSRTRISGETLTNQSFEKFWIDCILAEAAFVASPGGPLRLYWDADVDGTYLECHVTGDILRSYRPEQVRSGWTGSWKIVIDRLVKVPA